MDGEEFRIRGKELIDYMVDYQNNIGKRRVTPDVKPGYLQPLLPTEAPMTPEKFEDVMEDFESKILKGMVQWNHPRFHAYFPAGNSYPSIIGDMLSDMINCIGFSWASGPSCTELEIIVMDWYAKALGLPQKFLSTDKGGGVIQGSASDIVMVVLLAARHNALEALKKEYNVEDERKAELLPLLVAYCSKESHSCVEKAAKLCLVKLQTLDVTDDGSVSPETLEKAMAEDEAKGLKPFFYSSILGSTSQTAFDNLTELGPVCRKRPDYFWLHVDGAYAGSSFICPEMRPLMNGIEYANSFNTNPNKWLLTVFDAAALWVDDRIKLTSGLIVDPLYLKHEYEQCGFIDRRHWHIPLSRRFRALKLWFVFRLYGICGLQEYIRNHIKQAKYFESLVREDDRFEVLNIVRCGLVCFRLKGENVLTQDLLANINASGKLHMVPAKIKDNKYVIRFCVNHEKATEDDMNYAWDVIQDNASKLLSLLPEKISMEDNKKRRSLQHRRLSFTRSISKEVYEKRSSSLYDGATPILIIEDGEEEHNVFDDVFASTNVENCQQKTDGKQEE
ncbi:aromatic-L-amino-acid decarboxylase-like [Lycorma delicatula]|uniref:aromatic-L-amino-acid decarboxylase-like n=1 Tax=Lycorma delicatula TaxID=130591 RepID=UPI003F515911